MKNEFNRKILLKSFLFRFARFFLAASVMLSSLNLYAQQRTISGTVTGMDKAPLPGVSVSVKGTTVGITTGLDGKYVLQLPPDATTLVFSFVGMQTQEIPVTASNVYDIVMSETSQALEEVVVVGYGTQKKVSLTGAVSAVQIDAKIASRSMTNVSSGLTGLVAGLAVSQNSGMAGNDDANLLIRGLGTVNNASPLIVVDGMPDVDINRLNMNDIESISVLKDATSSAVYGSRAANGVILVTTRSGKGMSKTVINVSSSYALEHPTKVYQFMADYPRGLTLEQRLVAVNTLPSNYLFKNGTIDQWMALGKINTLQYPNTDWWALIMRNGIVQKNTVSASGGTDKSNFFVSVGTMNQNGLQINNDYSLYNARFNYDYKLNHNMNVGAKFSGNWSKNTYSNSAGFNTDLHYSPAGITPYDPVTGYYGGVMAYNEDPQAYNVFADLNLTGTHLTRQEVNPSLYWDWTPIKNLTARIDYAINYYNQFSWSANTPATAYNFQTNAYGSRVYVGANAGVSNSTSTGYKTQLNGRLNYQKTIAQFHNISAMVAYSEEYWYSRSQSSSRNDRLNPTLHEVDAALTDIQSAGGNSSTEGLRSYIGRVNYSAYDKYLLEFDFRYDGSSKFLPGHQFGFFPSGSVGWRFTEEEFMRSFTGGWLNSGKLRVSYGSLGNNSGVGTFEQQETLTFSPYYFNAPSPTTAKGFVNSKMVNQNLTWESTNVLNIGFDLAFLRSRLTVELDYYNRLTTGMNRPTDISIFLSGAYTAPRTNIGNLRNSGIEGNFRWHEARGNFNYSLSALVSYNQTTLEKWNAYLDRGQTFLNMPYHFLYIYQDKGIAQTWQDIYSSTPQGAQPGDILRLDLNGDGRIDGNDQKAYPNVQRDMPSANFSFTGNMSWKGFDFNILFQGAAGRKDIWLNDFNQTNFATQRNGSTWDTWNNPWSLDNRNGKWPRLGGNSNRNDQTFWLDNLAYLRLKNVQLGYTLPASWGKKIGIASLRIYGSGENLLTMTRFRGLDPESQGGANDAYPLNKSYSVGINLSF